MKTKYEKWILDRDDASDLTFLNARWEAIRLFSFAIPNEKALKAIAACSPILEVGAGTGYWAYELLQRGVDIIAVDPKPYSDTTAKPQKSWYTVRKDTAEKAIVRYCTKLPRSLFLCWPSLHLKWPAKALNLYKEICPRGTVIYVGDGAGGCTGNDEFHDILETKWVLKKTVEIPQWHGLHDALYIYKTKGS